MARRYSYREPAVTRGPDKAIPETRQPVLAKILEKLEKGPFLQQYSNGEFTSSSIAVGLTLEACKGVRVLECAGYTVHYDPVLELFWRHGGSFD
jgi:hypothetical protein